MIEANLGFCWSFQLVQSVYGLMESPSMRRPLSFLNQIGKPLAVLSAVLVTSLMQLPSLKKSPVWMFFTANLFCKSLPITCFEQVITWGRDLTINQ